MENHWRDIPGLPGYQMNPLRHVRTVPYHNRLKEHDGMVTVKVRRSVAELHALTFGGLPVGDDGGPYDDE